MVLSELRKTKPSRKVVQWLSAQKAESLFISVVSIGEIERGIQRTRESDGVFAAKLEQWLETLLNLYADRLLPYPQMLQGCGGDFQPSSGMRAPIC